jgi:hypothetical protein
MDKLFCPMKTNQNPEKYRLHSALWTMMSPQRSTAQSHAATYSRHQQISLVPPKSPLVLRGQGGGTGLTVALRTQTGSGGGTDTFDGNMTAMSPYNEGGGTTLGENRSGGGFDGGGGGSVGSRSTVRRPRIFEDTSRLLQEKPQQVMRGV